MVRILVTLAPASDLSVVTDGLRELGAVRVADPRAELPDVVVADFDEGSLEQLLAAVRALPGVADAGPEAFRWSSAAGDPGPVRPVVG